MAFHVVSIRHVNFITNYLKYALDYMNNTLSIFNENGSGFTLSRINKFQIIIASYKVLSGSGYIPLPNSLRGRKGLLNIDSTDYYCFHYCILASQFQAEALKLYKAKKRVSQIGDKKAVLNKPVKLSPRERNQILKNPATYLPFIVRLNFTGLSTPVKLTDLETFELYNNISINCYGLKGKQIVPFRTTQEEKARHVDLFLHQSEGSAHYILITNISAFLGRHHKSRHIFCKYCLRRFLQQHALNDHLSICLAKNKQQMRFPKETHYEFTKMHETLQFSFVSKISILNPQIRQLTSK